MKLSNCTKFRTYFKLDKDEKIIDQQLYNTREAVL